MAAWLEQQKQDYPEYAEEMAEYGEWVASPGFQNHVIAGVVERLVEQKETDALEVLRDSRCITFRYGGILPPFDEQIPEAFWKDMVWHYVYGDIVYWGKHYL